MLNTSEILGFLKANGIVFLKEGNGRVFSLKKNIIYRCRRAGGRDLFTF